jgi:hypothetical protein
MKKMDIRTLQERYMKIPEADVVAYIEAVCEMDWREVDKSFELNKSTFAPIMIKRGMIRNKPEYKDLYDRYRQTYLK